MKSILQANIDDVLRHMEEARLRKDVDSFNKEKILPSIRCGHIRRGAIAWFYSGKPCIG